MNFREKTSLIEADMRMSKGLHYANPPRKVRRFQISLDREVATLDGLDERPTNTVDE